MLDQQNIEEVSLTLEEESRDRFRVIATLTAYRADEVINRILKKFDAAKPIKFEIVSSPIVSARATVRDECDLISINRATITALYNYFSLLWMNSKYAPNAGRGGQGQDARCFELKSQILSGAGSLGARLAFNSGRTLVDDVNDDQRHKFAMAQLRYALDFIFYHEFIHLWEGHVDLKLASKAEANIDELQITDPPFSPRQSQFLELEADLSAAVETLDLNCFTDLREETGIGQVELERQYGPGANTAYHVIASVLTTILLFDDARMKASYQSHYPSWSVRWFACQIGLEAFSEGRFKRVQNNVTTPTIAGAGLFKAVSELAEFQGHDIPTTGELLQKTKIAARQSQSIYRDNAKTMRARLQPYSRADRPLTILATGPDPKYRGR